MVKLRTHPKARGRETPEMLRDSEDVAVSPHRLLRLVALCALPLRGGSI